MPSRIFTRSKPLVLTPHSLDSVLQDYLKRHASHWRPDTLRYHRCYLRVFFHYLSDRNLTTLEEITPAIWSEYCQHRLSKVSQTVRHHDGQCARLFFKDCVTTGLLPVSPLAEVKIVKMPDVSLPSPPLEALTEFLTALKQTHDPKYSDHARTKESPEQRAFYTAHHVALFMALVVTAARIKDILELEIGDVSLSDRTFHFRSTKTHKDRTVPFDADEENLVYLPLLETYLKVRPDVPCKRLFITHYGEPMTYNAFYCVWRRARAKCTHRFTIHSLRGDALTKLYLRSGDFKSAMMLAGHTSTQTAARYQKRDLSQLREALRKANLSEGIAPVPKKKII